MEPRLLEAHIGTCASCQAFQRFTEANLGRARIEPAPPMPDLSRRVVKLNAIADRASTWSIVRVLLAVIAVEVIIVSMRSLLLGDHMAASAHAARHLGSFSTAYGVGLLVIAARPARARTLLPVAAVLAGALALSAVIDIANGHIPVVDETIHLPEMLSVVLVWLLATPSSRRLSRDRGAPGLHAVVADHTGASTRRSG